MTEKEILADIAARIAFLLDVMRCMNFGGSGDAKDGKNIGECLV